jgi:TfoX/Sxy family transcriptional regulator of competence genes
MAYNTQLEEMIDAAADRPKNGVKKKMFGGVCYLLNGNMAFGIWKDFLIVRMNKEQAEQSLRQKNVEPFAVTGRPMAGWVMVSEAGWKTSAALEKWIAIGRDFAGSLPAKTGTAKPRKKKTLREYRG